MRHKALSNQQLARLGVEALAAVCLLWCAVRIFGLAHGAPVTLALAIAYVVPRLIHDHATWRSNASMWLMTAVGIGLCALTLANMAYITVFSGHTLDAPLLKSDSASYYQWALHHYDGSVPEPKITFYGFSVMMLCLWKLFGLNIAWPMAANLLLTLLTFPLTASLACRVLNGRVDAQAATVAATTIAIMASLGYYIAQAALLLKEPLVYIAMMLMAYALSGVVAREKRSRWLDVLAFTIGCFVMAWVRAKYVNFMFIGIAMLAFVEPRRNWRFMASLLVITVVCWYLGMALTAHYTVEQQLGNVVGSEKMAMLYTRDGIFNKIIGDYYHNPLWMKLLKLPLTIGTQWILPFPWPNSENDIVITPTNFVLRQRFGWYALGGVLLFYYAARSWRTGRAFMLWSWFPVLCYAGIAYMTCGTPSRYVLPFEPWVAIIGAYTLITEWRNRRFWTWMALYATTFATALIICYILTH